MKTKSGWKSRPNHPEYFHAKPIIRFVLRLRIMLNSWFGFNRNLDAIRINLIKSNCCFSQRISRFIWWAFFAKAVFQSEQILRALMRAICHSSHPYYACTSSLCYKVFSIHFPWEAETIITCKLISNFSKSRTRVLSFSQKSLSRTLFIKLLSLRCQQY